MSWGGRREGAGRKVGWRKENPNPRKNHSLLAHDDEWLLIKKFSELVKYGEREKCEEFISAFDG